MQSILAPAPRFVKSPCPDCGGTSPACPTCNDASRVASLVAWIERQAAIYDLHNTDAAFLVAHALRGLAAEVRTLHARTPDEVWDRRATLDALYADTN
jgi:hypothetical protein